MPVNANVNTSIPWQIVVIAICLIAIFFSTAVLAADWWKMAVPATFVGGIALVALFA